MLKYRVIVLGSLNRGDKEYSLIECDKVAYEHSSVVFLKRNSDLSGYVTVLSVPQVASIIELIE